MVSSGNYAEYNTVKIKLRIDDDSMRDEIRLYSQDIQDLIDNRLRAKLGENNIYGSKIELPLTHLTIPTIPLELKGIAADLVVAKIRLQNSEKTTLWDSAVKVLDDYLNKVYGWTRAVKFCPNREVVMSPVTGIVGATVTISGSVFEPNKTLKIYFDGIQIVTSPAIVNTDANGIFTSSTFAVPNSKIGQRELKIIDSFGGKILKFLVTE
jgi:hypothetical protein